MRAIGKKLIAELQSRPIWWGYGSIVAIAILSTIGILFYSRRYALSDPATASEPYVIFSLTIFMAICLARPLWLVLKRHPEPLRQLGHDFITYRGWVVTSGLMALCVPQTLEFSGSMKKAIPQIVPFYADGFLIELEHRLLGSDAWELTHAVFGAEATRVIDLLYGSWHLVNIGLLCWLILTSDRKFQVRSVLSYQLVWVLLGGFLATALSSVGPCFLQEFTGNDRFSPLMDRIREIGGEDGLHSLIAMSYLLANDGKDAFGAGISAMPSLHVAIAFLTVLIVFDRTKLAILRGISLAYLLVIIIGSVHLGWHYLLDGVVSIILVIHLWWATGRFVDTICSSKAR